MSKIMVTCWDTDLSVSSPILKINLLYFLCFFIYTMIYAMLEVLRQIQKTNSFNRKAIQIAANVRLQKYLKNHFLYKSNKLC